MMSPVIILILIVKHANYHQMLEYAQAQANLGKIIKVLFVCSEGYDNGIAAAIARPFSKLAVSPVNR